MNEAYREEQILTGRSWFLLGMSTYRTFRLEKPGENKHELET